MKKTKKIIFVLPSLVPGGAERVISFVAQNINKQDFDSKLLITGYSKDTSYDVSSINVKYLNTPRVLFSIPYLILYFLKEKPDIVVSSIYHLNAVMGMISTLFKKTKFIGREATILSSRKNEKTKKFFSGSIVHNSLKKIDALVCQSDDMVKDMIKNYQIPKSKVTKINNPISRIPKLKNDTRNDSCKKFITVGRLTEVKGHERLLTILSKLNEPFQYTIIGDGHEEFKKSLFNTAKKLGIENNIKHIPFTKKVDQYIAENDLFLQGSFVEGFPNSLLESCVVGTPVIAFNVPGGTKEIIENGVNGFLVENESMYLKKLKENHNWSPIEVRNSVIEKFSKKKIIKEFEDLFIKILS